MVQPLSPMPPNEMSACSAAKSGQWWHHSFAYTWHSLSGILTSVPSFSVTYTSPLTLILVTWEMSIP